MRTAIFQLIIIDDVIKIEFKVTTADGYSRLIEKIIETEADYEAFMNDVRFGIETLDEIIKQAIKSSGNENTGDNADNMQPVKVKSVAV